MDINFTRDELAELPVSELQTTLTNDLEAKQALFETMSVDDLKKEEEALMEIFKENDERIEKVTYKLPKESQYDGAAERASILTQNIIGFLNRIKVNWQTSLGMYQAISFWKHFDVSKDEVPYHVFDSTIRLLGTVEYQGYNDCRMILFINNWVSTVHQEYMADQLYTQYLHAVHQSILERLQPDEPVAEQ